MNTQHRLEPLSCTCYGFSNVYEVQSAAIEKLTQQRDELQQRVEQLLEQCLNFEAEAFKAERQHAELLADAMRYRWLRDTNLTRAMDSDDVGGCAAGEIDTIMQWDGNGSAEALDPAQLDAAVDAAIAKAGAE